MTPSRKPMETYLNLHAHRPAASPSETVVRNYILPLPPSGHEEPEYGQTFSAGIHPWYIPAHPEETLKELERLAASPSCKSIGEAGLDKYASTPLPLQRELFIRQAELAVSRQLPVIIHCVKAWDELLAIKKDFPETLPCIIHGFRGKPQLAESLLSKGFYLSFGFRFHPQSLTPCPSDRLFFESDEDLRPIDTLYHIAAELRSCTPEGLRAQCWENLVRTGPSSKK